MRRRSAPSGCGSADLVVLDSDLFALDRYAVKDVKVVETIRQGRTTYVRTEEVIATEKAFVEQVATIVTSIDSCC